MKSTLFSAVIVAAYAGGSTKFQQGDYVTILDTSFAHENCYDRGLISNKQNGNRVVKIDSVDEHYYHHTEVGYDTMPSCYVYMHDDDLKLMDPAEQCSPANPDGWCPPCGPYEVDPAACVDGTCVQVFPEFFHDPKEGCAAWDGSSNEVPIEDKSVNGTFCGPLCEYHGSGFQPGIITCEDYEVFAGDAQPLCTTLGASPQGDYRCLLACVLGNTTCPPGATCQAWPVHENNEDEGGGIPDVSYDGICTYPVDPARTFKCVDGAVCLAKRVPPKSSAVQCVASRSFEVWR
jgi:hypothetical protein